MKKIKAGYNQSVIDIAIQEYGDAEGVTMILDDNPELTINSVIKPGSVIRIRETALNIDIVDFFEDNNLHPATADETYVAPGDYDPDDYDLNDYY